MGPLTVTFWDASCQRCAKRPAPDQRLPVRILIARGTRYWKILAACGLCDSVGAKGVGLRVLNMRTVDFHHEPVGPEFTGVR
jgi:hypothetical protein